MNAYRATFLLVVIIAVAAMGAALFGCAQISSSSHDITTHCMQHTIGGDSKAGTTTIEDCDVSIDSKSKSSGF